MKKIWLTSLLLLAVGITAVWYLSPEVDSSERAPMVHHPIPEEEAKSLEPHDQWMVIRSYPDGFNKSAYLESMREVHASALESAVDRDVELSLDWQQEGPGNIGGRVDVLTLDPADSDIIYAGATNGGIFRSEDAGETWDPIFDDQPYLAIGAIAIDPTDSDIIYVGTGDRNFTGASFIGNGVYKSEDFGETWSEMGLSETGVVTEILIDPEDPDRIFASTLGNPYAKNTDRGVYRSDDGGMTWENKLFLSDSSGVIDLIMNPEEPQVLYASGYNRMRNYYSSTIIGPEAGIWKTTNYGETWFEMSTGLPEGELCRIGLAISNEEPGTVFALYVDETTIDVKDIYKTENGGATWEPIGIYDDDDGLSFGVMGGFGWYFGEVYLNPYNNDHFIIPGVEMFQSLDGGITWEQNVPDWWTYEVHADKHAIAFLDEDSYIIGTDGGLYKTDNNGASWTDIENIPITQFYHIDVDPQANGVYGGGAQDNGSMSGNADTFNEWERLWGGDGFRVTFLEQDEFGHYYETQNGNLRYISDFGDNISVSPDVSGDDRSNWDMPYLVNENTEELFTGTSKIQLMEGAPFAGFYMSISEDLTRVGLGEFDPDRYHTISEMDQPSRNPNMLFVGTSDGLMWRGDRDAGVWDWTNITGDLPNHYVTGVRCSPNQDSTVYVTVSGYKDDNDLPFIYKSDDLGETWESVSGDLPATTVNDLLIVPGYAGDEYLFAALDGGVYFSESNGAEWEYVGEGMPFVTVSELHLDIPNKKLIAGTYSRSMWSYDVDWMEIGEIDYTSVNEEEDLRFEVFPNPCVDQIQLKGVANELAIIYDTKGRVMLQTNVNGNPINVAHFPVGMYVIQIGEQTRSFVKK